jgi:hypothetical protein
LGEGLLGCPIQMMFSNTRAPFRALGLGKKYQYQHQYQYHQREVQVKAEFCLTSLIFSINLGT